MSKLRAKLRSILSALRCILQVQWTKGHTDISLPKLIHLYTLNGGHRVYINLNENEMKEKYLTR